MVKHTFSGSIPDSPNNGAMAEWKRQLAVNQSKRHLLHRLGRGSYEYADMVEWQTR